MFKPMFSLLLVLVLIGCNKDESNPTQPATTGTITGKVLTAIGDTAIAGAVISTTPPSSTMSTSSNGGYTIENVSPGNYVVTSTKSGFFDGRSAIKIVAGSSTPAIIQMTRVIGQSGMIRGVVKTALGDTVIADATVTTSPSTSSVTTNSLGEYAIINIPGGAYTVTAAKSGLNPGNAAVSVSPGQTAIGDVRMNVIVNHPPNTPIPISPLNAVIGQARSLTLNWSCSDVDGDNIFYDVYLDRVNPPAQRVSASQTSTNFTSPTLDSAATYFWSIVARDSRGAASNGSSVFAFTTINLGAGLTAYYPFNGNANDESGNGRGGTNNGATLTTDRFGIVNRSFNFNGTSNYIKASATGLPTAERTTSVWFLTSDLTSKQHVLLAYGGNSSSSPGTSWLLTVSPTFFNVAVHFETNDLQYYFVTAPVAHWHNVTAVTSNSGTRIYVDGAVEATNSVYINNTYVLGKDFSVGVSVDRYGSAPFTDANVDYFIGKIDDVRIYSRALTLAEIQALYHEGGW